MQNQIQTTTATSQPLSTLPIKILNLNGRATATTLADLNSAISLVKAELRPADKMFVVRALGEMAVLQAHRNDDADQARLKMELYTRKLCAYPDYAIRAACGKTRKWFPTWAELEEDLEAALGGRRARLAWLERGEVISARDLASQAAAKALDREMSELGVHIADCCKYDRLDALPALIAKWEHAAEKRHIAVDRHIIGKAKALIEGAA